MYFALLVSQLPHVSDARGFYPDMLARPTKTDRARQAAARCLAGLRALLELVG
ncbi:hypothetical protein [Trinickia acidisoli]|uniref:hypothetical protein n=1 Tax=Trinickia acidisoli TaxID=2767482 RepID=UPI001A8FDE96|nr:hypothetical protein [Trinickia acidisoli]